jgi:hypothetical protein
MSSSVVCSLQNSVFLFFEVAMTSVSSKVRRHFMKKKEGLHESLRRNDVPQTESDPHIFFSNSPEELALSRPGLGCRNQCTVPDSVTQ